MPGLVQGPVELPSFLELLLLVSLGRREPFQVKPTDSAYTAATVAIVVHKLPS